MTNGYDALDLADSPTIVLGGQPYKLPKLALRQIRRVAPLVMGMKSMVLGELTEADVDRVYSIVFAGFNRIDPDITREEFDELGIGFGEALAALPVVARQAGMTMVGNASPAAPSPLPETQSISTH